MPDANKLCLMLVDDDLDDRYFFSAALKKLGEPFELIEAHNGSDALKKLHAMTRFPDYIFLDMNMPLMNGKEFLMEIKRFQHLGSIPVIIYTTSTNEDDMKTTRELGALHYMIKPLDVTLLPEAIISVLKTIRSDRTVPE